MRWLRALPLERKLTVAILSTSGFALLTTCVGIMAYETATFRRRALDELSASAKLIAANSTAALTFHDPEAAQEYLDTLGTQPEIVSSVIYAGEGAIFSSYLRADGAPHPFPAKPEADGHRFEAGKLFLTQPITLGGERLGTIYLESDLGPWRTRITRYAGIVAVVLLSLVLATLVLEAALRPLVSKPIRDLARVAQGVTERKDYSVRVVKRSADEIGRLVEVFNQMLSAVEERDVALQTARDELERRVEERTAEVLDLYNQAPCGYHSLDRDGVFVNINDTELAWLGHARDELVGKKKLTHFLTPESQKAFEEEFPKFKEKGFARDVEFDLIRKDGRIIRVLINATAMRDEAGGFLKSRSTVVDITARKRAEEQVRHLNVELERRVEERTAELRRSIEELEQFAHVASHDLQEPLRMVSSFVQLLAQRYGDRLDEDGHDFIRFAVEGATRMHELINALLAYSRLETAGVPFAPVSCEEALGRALVNLHVAVQESGAVVTHGPLPRVQGDGTQIVQLFQNLVGNAIKFRKKEDPPRVRVEAEVLGDQWRFSVHDNGIGIDPRHVERIFVIFQRLHGREEYPGTGIGLAICKKIVDRHGGTIWVESRPGEGSVFRFTLPKATEEAAAWERRGTRSESSVGGPGGARMGHHSQSQGGFRSTGSALLMAVLLAAGPDTLAQSEEDVQTPSELKKLSLEELFEMEVTSVSKKPEKLSRAAAAIHVVTDEDIRRSGALSIPEALRNVPGVEVARVDSRQYAITARGFNGTIANKLLVLVDGRSVYTPLFSGVFWDVQDTFLPDVARIEVIRGPGATLWGANAVNGVINVLTKGAEETQGFLITGGGGNEERGFGGVRYGGRLGQSAFYRLYAQRFDRDDTVLPDGPDAGDRFRSGRGGFRIDWTVSKEDRLTFHGDLYDATVSQPAAEDIDLDGGNLIVRWTREPAEGSSLQLQAYYDRTGRDLPPILGDRLDTYDVDFQHRFPLGALQDVVWGLGYRRTLDEVDNSPGLAFLPPHLTQNLFTGFVQDEFKLLKDRLHLTFGSKVEHTDYTGFEVQPSGRLAWTVTPQHTVWAAVSRVVRTPSRIDRDFFVPQSPPFVLAGGPNFDSEVLHAYEVGYKTQPVKSLTASAETFYDVYDKLRSLETGPPPFLSNGLDGKAYGVELEATYQALRWWRWNTGYTFLNLELRPELGSTDTTSVAQEGDSPHHQAFVKSWMDLPFHIELDVTGRHVGRLPGQAVEAYTALDLRLGWRPTPKVELAILGQNLLEPVHAEFGMFATRREIQRSLYAKLTCRF